MCTTQAINPSTSAADATAIGNTGDTVTRDLCCRTAIDMVTPEAAGATLRLDNAALLDVVNRGLLPAYDLGGVIRFRAADVELVAAEFVSA